MLLYTSLMFGDIEPSHADTDYSKREGRKKTWESYFTFVLQIVPFNLQSEQRLTQFLLQSSWRLLATV